MFWKTNSDFVNSYKTKINNSFEPFYVHVLSYLDFWLHIL